MTDEELALVRQVVAEAVSAALATHAPRKSRAGLLTLDEASELIRTPAETIRRWIWEGRLVAYKPGKHQLVRESELLALVEASETRKKRVANRRKQMVGD